MIVLKHVFICESFLTGHIVSVKLRSRFRFPTKIRSQFCVRKLYVITFGRLPFRFLDSTQLFTADMVLSGR